MIYSNEEREMTQQNQPTKEQIRQYLEARLSQDCPPPSMTDIRRHSFYCRPWIAQLADCFANSNERLIITQRHAVSASERARHTCARGSDGMSDFVQSEATTELSSQQCCCPHSRWPLVALVKDPKVPVDPLS